MPHATPSDRILLFDLRVDCILGCYPAERTTPRPVLFQVALDLDTRPAAATDALPDALNYELVESALRRLAADGRFHLLETLANRAADAMLALSPAIRAVTLRAEKPGALPHTRSVAVEVVRLAAGPASPPAA